jgi:hypothetical protein
LFSTKVIFSISRFISLFKSMLTTFPFVFLTTVKKPCILLVLGAESIAPSTKGIGIRLDVLPLRKGFAVMASRLVFPTHFLVPFIIALTIPLITVEIAIRTMRTKTRGHRISTP